MPGAGRDIHRTGPDLPGRHPAPERAELPAGCGPGPQRQARQGSHALCFGLYALHRDQLAARRADTAARRRRLEFLAGDRPVAAVQQAVCRRKMARPVGLRLRRRVARLGCAHGRPLPVGQQGRRHHAGRISSPTTEYHRALCQRREAGARLPQDPVSETSGLGSIHRARAPSVSSATRAGSKPATKGEIEVSSPSLKAELASDGTKVLGLDVSAHARNFFDCMRTRSTRPRTPK